MGIAPKIMFRDLGEGVPTRELAIARKELPNIVAHEMQWIGEGVRLNAKARFKKQSGPLGLGNDFSTVDIVISSTGIVVGTIGSSKPYALIRDEGGTIRAKVARILAIPVPGSRASQGNAQGPRDFVGVWRKFKKPTATGAMVGFFSTPGDELLFIGKHQVEQDGTHYFSDAWRARADIALQNIGDSFFRIAEEGS